MMSDGYPTERQKGTRKEPQAREPLRRGGQRHGMQIDIICLGDSDTELQISVN